MRAVENLTIWSSPLWLPLGYELYQAVKGMSAAARMSNRRRNLTRRMLRRSANPRNFRELLSREGHPKSGWTYHQSRAHPRSMAVQILAKILQRASGYLYSSLRRPSASRPTPAGEDIASVCPRSACSTRVRSSEPHRMRSCQKAANRAVLEIGFRIHAERLCLVVIIPAEAESKRRETKPAVAAKADWIPTHAALDRNDATRKVDVGILRLDP
jgi:hypothetical protein